MFFQLKYIAYIIVKRKKPTHSVEYVVYIWGLPLITYAHRGRWGGSRLPYISIAYNMQKGGEWVQIACKIAYVLNRRPLCNAHGIINHIDFPYFWGEVYIWWQRRHWVSTLYTSLPHNNYNVASIKLWHKYDVISMAYAQLGMFLQYLGSTMSPKRFFSLKPLILFYPVRTYW